ncbi:hypothetical protein GL270_11080 [Aeromonas veronii]|uniref:hypothetical protein n=1 Tax=Aeromonas veronii TaxID=654 RepID=UPI001C5B9352|nr:hypothetical protein [Aeromonas veronii]MBW3781786.1 hypothetical protein [Aeromonas veronii]
MDKKTIIYKVAQNYIEQCQNNVSAADVKSLCIDYNHEELGYSSCESMKAAISKVLRKKGFNKKTFTLELVRSSYERIDLVEEKAKDTIIKLIQEDLKKHDLKYSLIRDHLQQMELGVREHHSKESLEEFKQLVIQGHSYTYSVSKSALSEHIQKKAKSWFIKSHGGDERETYRARRENRKHSYINLKDYLLLCNDENKLARIWTTIGFSFADGSINNTSVQLVITKSDSYYLSEHCIPTLLDESVENNLGPELISAHSNNHETSFNGSKPVSRAHIEDSHLAAFLSELGMPSNKITEQVVLSDKITSLPDRYFFCFLSGLFAGDGCITRQKKGHLHLDFDLHRKEFCDELAKQIEERTDIPMRASSHLTKCKKQHYKLVASTNWRAISLLLLMYYYSPFHLIRKTIQGDKYIDEMVQAIPAYSFLKIRPSNIQNMQISEEELFDNLNKLKKMRRNQHVSISK